MATHQDIEKLVMV